MEIIGHRGAMGLAPENTIAGFKKALEHGVDAIECDVHTTVDNIPILIHDADLEDPAGNKLQVSQHTFAELKSHKAELPTLEEALRFVRQRVPVMIELKPHEPSRPVIAVLRRLINEGWRAKDFEFISFSYRILEELRAAFPDCTVIVNHPWSSLIAVWRAKKLHTSCVNLSRWTIWGGAVRFLTAKGYAVYCYTLNDPRRARQLNRHGLRGIITDFPDRF